MTAAVGELAPPVLGRADDGGAPARRAVVRWAGRLFRREWRQQVLLLALLAVAVAATVIGLGTVSNVSELKADPSFGTANTILSLPGSDRALNADIAAVRDHVGVVDVIAHETIPVPGSVSSLDVRAQDPHGTYGAPTLRLDSGRYPVGAGEVAVTNGVATTFGLHVGSTWTIAGRTWRVVGTVENPLNLLDQFALVPPGQADPPSQVSVLLNAPHGTLQSFHLPSGLGLTVAERGTSPKALVDVVVLVVATLGLVFVGLVGVAGFAVMAQRRQRALGMLGALGATDRHVRLVMLANGAAVGATASVVGAVAGLAAWFAFAPDLQSMVGHRIDRWALPWWPVGATMVLAFVTGVAAAWWPARAVARIPVVAALSGRPPRPQPAHRFAALGGVLFAAGLILLADAASHRGTFIIAGVALTGIGLPLLSPLAIRALAAPAGRASVAVRLAWRDLVRYQGRSGAALGAVTLAIGIAATITVSAAASATPTGAGNLPSDQLMVYLTPAGFQGQIPPLTAAQLQTVNRAVDGLAASIGTHSVVPLEQAYDPSAGLQAAAPAGPGGGTQPAGYGTASLVKVTTTGGGQQWFQQQSLYVATPAVLARYGISPGQVKPGTDVLAAAPANLAGLQLMTGVGRSGPSVAHPAIQTFSQLPRYSSAPTALVTQQALHRLGLQTLPAAWLVQTSHPLTGAQIATARKATAAAGLYLETRNAQTSESSLRTWSTTAGILLALGVLAMTVGLIRSETANDLRTLAATGAPANTRRSVTAATAGGLALLGAWLGTAGAYAALLTWHHGNLHPLGQVPVLDLVIILAGLPVLATAAGWLLAGREPPAIGRRPLE